MSAQTGKPGRTRRRGVGDLVKGGAPIVGLTAYTAPVAGLLDPHVDFLLVGDSLGMVVYGFDSTLPVTVEMMTAHGAAVMRASSQALVVVDLPFGSYQAASEQAFRTAARIMAETGCTAVKLEGGVELAETVRFLTGRGIPVMGHVGLMPQSVNAPGGFKVQGRGPQGSDRIAADAAAIAAAGAFALVIEGTMESVARAITEAVPIPTIGIGASPACDGQILVTDDVLGLFTQFKPRFVKRYAELAPLITQAAAHMPPTSAIAVFPPRNIVSARNVSRWPAVFAVLPELSASPAHACRRNPGSMAGPKPDNSEPKSGS